MKKWAQVPQKPIIYEASDDGQIVRATSQNGSLKTIRARLRLNPTTHGYQRIEITLRLYVHRLVWEAFHGPIPSGFEINHRDGNKANNRLDNLELVTRSENMLHCHRQLKPNLNRARGLEHGRTKLTPDAVKNILELRRTGMSLKKIGRRYNVSDQAIHLILKGWNWRHVTGIRPIKHRPRQQKTHYKFPIP